MEKIRISTVELERTAALAPMASVADRAYRTICKRFGAAYVVGEMASAKGLCHSSRKTAELLEVTAEERPMAVQLFGADPADMAQAAKLCAQYAPQAIDINMGCPVPKVVGGGSGSALMKTPDRAAEIVRAVREATDLPVTVKIRAGWDEHQVNAVDFARRMEQSGAAAVTVHGRTRRQMYAGAADWGIIKAVKDAVSIPVIGSGDVTDLQSCLRMYRETGCDLVMIGRGSLGRPWLFRQIRSYFESGILLPDPPPAERMEIMLRHIALLCADKGEARGMKEARKLAGWYVKGLRGAATLRRECSALGSYADAKRLSEDVLRLNPQTDKEESAE